MLPTRITTYSCEWLQLQFDDHQIEKKIGLIIYKATLIPNECQSSIINPWYKFQHPLQTLTYYVFPFHTVKNTQTLTYYGINFNTHSSSKEYCLSFFSTCHKSKIENLYWEFCIHMYAKHGENLYLNSEPFTKKYA